MGEVKKEEIINCFNELSNTVESIRDIAFTLGTLATFFEGVGNSKISSELSLCTKLLQRNSESVHKSSGTLTAFILEIT